MWSLVYSHASLSSPNDNVINLIHLGGTVSHGNDLVFEDGNATNAFDDSVDTVWCFKKVSDYPWIVWTFKKGRREISNMYQVYVDDDNFERNPKHWRIYGSNDGLSWRLLDERDNVIWKDRFDGKRFVMSNTVEYNSYKFEFIERSNENMGDAYQLSEWRLLYTSTPPTVAPTVSPSPAPTPTPTLSPPTIVPTTSPPTTQPPVPTPTPASWFPVYDPFILGDNCNYEVPETCLEEIISDRMVLRRYLAVRDAFPLKALKHTRVLALSGMTLSAVELLRESLSKQAMSSYPIDMYFYSDSKLGHSVNASMVVPLIVLAEFTRPSRIVFGDGTMQREGMAAVIRWMVENRVKSYFMDLEYLQISGHKVAAYNGTEEEAATLQNQIVSNLHTMCTDKDNFPKLNTLNFDNNEYNNGFDAALRGACNQTETGVTIRAMQVVATYPSMCSTTRQDNYEYYDMEDEKEIAQCRFTWNWEMDDTSNVYATAGPFPNESTESCDEPGDHSITLFQYPSSSYSICFNESVALFPNVHGRVDSYSVVSGSLPAGLVISEVAGIISGIPSVMQSTNVTIQAENGYTSRTTALSLSIVPHLDGNIYNVHTNQTVFLNIPITPILPTSCSSCTYSAVDSLPAGITLDSVTGQISGAPTEAGRYEFTIQRSNGCSNHTDRIVLVVIGNPTLSYLSSYALALGESVNIQPVLSYVDSLSIVSGSLPSGLSWDNRTGAITGSPTGVMDKSTVVFMASNRYNITRTTVVFRVLQRITQFNYESSFYTYAVESAISLSPHIVGPCSNYSIQSGILPSGIQLNSTTGVISGTFLQSVSNQRVTISAQNELGSMTVVLTFTVVSSISSFSYPQSSYLLAKNRFFSTTPVVNGNVTSYSISFGELPQGLEYSEQTGVISGTPSVSLLNQIVEMKAMNAYGFKTAMLVISVLEPISTFSYPQNHLCLSKDESFSMSPSATGDHVTYSITSGLLPMGLSLNRDTGVISGIPTVSTPTYESIVVRIDNELGSRSFSIGIRVFSRFTEFSYPKKEYVFAVGDDATVLPTVNSEDVEYSLEGSLPKGIAFNKENGEFRVFATTSVKRQQFMVVASNDLDSHSCMVSFDIQVNITRLSYPEAATTLMKGKRYSLVPLFNGTEVFFSVTHGSIPQGMTLNSYSGIIEGRPLDFFFKSKVTVQARNEVGALETSLQLVVLPTSMSLISVILVVVVLLFAVVLYCTIKKKMVVFERNIREKQKDVVGIETPKPDQMEIEMREIAQHLTRLQQMVPILPSQYGGEQLEENGEGQGLLEE